jgi:hypothetical protein
LQQDFAYNSNLMRVWRRPISITPLIREFYPKKGGDGGYPLSRPTLHSANLESCGKIENKGIEPQSTQQNMPKSAKICQFCYQKRPKTHKKPLATPAKPLYQNGILICRIVAKNTAVKL